MKHSIGISTRRTAFTLIEILVVLAIIGILSAILFPVFSSARESARIATCSSNLKQIYVGTQLYMNDSNGTYPYRFLGASCDWADMVYPYVKSTAVFECPNAEQGEFKLGCPPDTPSTETSPEIRWGGSYNYNLLRVGKRQRIRESGVGRPSDVALFVDGSGSFITPYDRLYESTMQANQNNADGERGHRGGFNFCFADGHIKWISADNMDKRSLWINDRDADYKVSPTP